MCEKVREYIHYGHDSFRSELFVPIRNHEMFTKPHGGLWASAVNAPFGWKEWTERENFRKGSYTCSFRFRLKDEAKVCHIYRIRDLKGLPQVDNEFNLTWCMLDFEKMLSDGWDAIELHLSEEDMTGVGFLEGLYWQLYGWDCDSILVMNPDVIMEVE
jgi:hypothetical protein